MANYNQGVRFTVGFIFLIVSGVPSIAEEQEIDKIILARLNTGHVLGYHPGIQPPGIPRVADRIVSLNVTVVSVDSMKEVPYADVGKRSGDAKFYSFTNCGSLEEKKHFKDTLTTVTSTEVELTKSVKTSTSFSGKMSYSGDYFWGKIGTEMSGSYSKEVSFTDRNKQSASTTASKEDEFDFVAPPSTRVIYQATSGTGYKKIQFSGTVLVTGVYHYVISNIWDQNAVIEVALPDPAMRTFPFEGTLSTVTLTTTDLQKSEAKLNASECKKVKESAEKTGTQLLILPPAQGAKAFISGTKVKL